MQTGKEGRALLLPFSPLLMIEHVLLLSLWSLFSPYVGLPSFWWETFLSPMNSSKSGGKSFTSFLIPLLLPFLLHAPTIFFFFCLQQHILGSLPPSPLNLCNLCPSFDYGDFQIQMWCPLIRYGGPSPVNVILHVMASKSSCSCNRRFS